MRQVNVRKFFKEPRMLRVGIKPKKAMEVFDKTFKYVNQHPPYVKAYVEDPTTAFMIESYALIAEWPNGAMRQLLRTLTKVEPAPDSAGMIGQVKRLLHEVLDDKDIDKKDGRTDFGRWRMWPHIRVVAEKIVDSTRSEKLTDQEREAMSKLAVKKKVASVKKTASAKKTAPAKAKKGGTAFAEATIVSRVGTRDKGGAKTKLLNLIPRNKGKTVAALTAAAEKEGISKKKVLAWLPFLLRYKYVKVGK